MNLLRGQRFKLEQVGVNSKLKLEVDMVLNSNLELDMSCFGVDENDNLSDDRYFIFYNQLSSPEGAIKKENNKDTFYIDFSLLPKNIKNIILSISIDGNGNIKEVINEGTIKFSNEKEVVASFNFKGQEYTTEKSIVLLEIYLKDNIWRSNIIASGFNGGLGDILRNYGGEEAKPEEKVEPVIVNATPKEVKKEIPKNEETEQIKVNKSFLEKKKKVETIVLEKAPHLIDLTKKVTVTLEKKNLQNVIAKVVVVLDRSGSMYRQYREGDVQRAMNKLLPIALMFDDDGELDAWAFAQKSIHLSSINLDNINDYLINEKDGWNRWDIGGVNNEPVVMEDIIDMYEKSNEPVYIIFISDGGIYKKGPIKKLLIKSSSKPIFWQFVGIGGSDYGILEELDTMKKRVVDNADFFAIDNIDALSDEELYEKLLNEFPKWLKEAKDKNII
ncbi:MAG: VWA domain-containing protein [Clostridium sp.]|nr:VWA domain-containing protein [Clostridium sp.]